MLTEQKTGASQFVENVYNSISKDAGVQAALDKLKSLLEFPDAPFIAIVIGTGTAAASVKFVILPLVGFVKAGTVVGEAAGLIQSAITEGSVSAATVFSVLQLLATSGTLVPALVVGSVVAGAVTAVRLLKHVANGQGERGVFTSDEVETSEQDGKAERCESQASNSTDSEQDNEEAQKGAPGILNFLASVSQAPVAKVRVWYKVMENPRRWFNRGPKL